jgi:outer membrane protein TolC
MALPQIALILALVNADTLKLSFAEAVRRAAAGAPQVTASGFRADAAVARVRQVRSALLPSLTVQGFWMNRNFNSKAQGISFPGVPTLIGPFNSYDGRVRATQTLLDFSSLSRVGAARSQVHAANAERSAVVETAAQNAALAYLRASRAQAVVNARQADSSLAAELVGLAIAQQRAGVSAAIDVTRARAQLVTAEGLLIVARNQLDRGRIDVTSALGVDPATPLTLTDTLAASLGVAAVPATRDSGVALALANRPDLRSEVARGAAARQTRSAIRAERLPRLALAGDYGSNGPTVPQAIATRDLTLQVSLPILDGFRREARASEQDAVVRESQVREADLRRQIAADVDAALLDLRSAQAQQAVAAEQLRLAADELAQSRERFKAGVAGNIEIINAQSNLIRARDTDIDARFAAALAHITLARAVGVARTLH